MNRCNIVTNRHGAFVFAANSGHVPPVTFKSLK